MLFLYLCAGVPSLCHLLKQHHCYEVIGPLTQLQSNQVKVLSKALISRLIPVDVVSHNTTILILIQDDEVDYLTSLIALAHSYQAVPVVSIMMDLSRSPHNLFMLASKDVTVKVSEVMEAWSEDDQAQSAQLIWRLMESNYDGSEEVSAIVNNGSLTQAEGMYLKVLYIVSCPWLKEISTIKFTVLAL